METPLSPTAPSKTCTSCGGTLRYEAGTDLLRCTYCNSKQAIDIREVDRSNIEESDYLTALRQLAESAETRILDTVTCLTCNAMVTLKPDVVADACPYCSTPIVLRNATTCAILKPDYLVPFEIDLQTAKVAYSDWVDRLWLAPHTLKNAKHNSEKLQGVYVPFWTYDATARSQYYGFRGVTQYAVVDLGEINGSRAQPRVPRTNWTPAQGNITYSFDDVVVSASQSLPKKTFDNMARWNLKKLVPYAADYLTGYRAEAYSIGLEAGFAQAKRQMERQLREVIKNHIGGDQQKITATAVSYRAIHFKHILLPVWISSYRYRGKIYRFVVNAQTGQVAGERPYSTLKVAGVIFLGILLLGLLLGIARILAI